MATNMQSDDPGLPPREDGDPRPSAAAGNVLTAFTFTDKAIRAVFRDGEPWFVAADVCAVLDQPNSSQVVSRLEEDERGLHSVDTPGGPQDVLVISESGLYELVSKSRKPQARPFQRWVTREVLPSIRKTGAYALPRFAPDPIFPPQPGPRPATRRLAEPFYHGGIGTMVVSTSPGPMVGSMPVEDLTVCFSSFHSFVSHRFSGGEIMESGPDYPNESNVLRYLSGRGRGDECARDPISGKWLFRLAALQDWYREQGSILVSPPN